jgi:hemerythrin-like metal-binding protein
MTIGRLAWDHRFAVGIGNLDDAHKELLDLYNRLAWACENEATVSNVREKIRTFLLYADWHFSEEEECMRRIHYPNYMDHKADHERLLQDARDFVESFGTALRQDDGRAIASYFGYWLSKHMANQDSKLKNFSQNSTSVPPTQQAEAGSGKAQTD